MESETQHHCPIVRETPKSSSFDSNGSLSLFLNGVRLTRWIDHRDYHRFMASRQYLQADLPGHDW